MTLRAHATTMSAVATKCARAMRRDVLSFACGDGRKQSHAAMGNQSILTASDVVAIQVLELVEVIGRRKGQ